jgi:carbon-monoxide dehydrogenase medium subunit
MFPKNFEYFVPNTVTEVSSLLKRYGSEAKILAGGMSLIPLMKLRLASPRYLIDINRLPRLDFIREVKGRLLIGALTRHHSLETSNSIKRRVPLLSETASWIGDPQVRNSGTIGGSLSHADPSGDLGATILALRGEMKVKGPSRERLIKADDFFLDTFTTAIKQTELLTEVRVPIPGPRSGGSYLKLERKAGDFATVGVAAEISLDSEGKCSYVGIGLTALGPKNLRARKAEAVLLGNEPTRQKIAEAAEAAANETQPLADPLRGSVEYRRQMTNVFTRRALTLSVERAGAK